MHISSDEVFSKILKKPSIVCTENKMIPHMKAFGLFNKMKQKKNSKWPPKKSNFPALPILNIILWKFRGLVLGFVFSLWNKPRRFIWGSVYFCTMDGFFRILNKALSKLICTRQFDLIRSNLILIYLFRDTNSVTYSEKYPTNWLKQSTCLNILGYM